MSKLQYFTYAGFGEQALENTHYNQAVRVGDRIEISGQPGLDRLTSTVPADLAEEVDHAFANVAHAIEQAGGRMDQVYKLTIYFAPLEEAAMRVCVEALRKWFPRHRPCLTGVGVAKLALEGMRVEVEAVAYLGE